LANELHLPLGKMAVIHLMSMDDIHDFAVPEFRIKQDIVPGMDIPLWITPTKVGTYDLACAQLCGFGHSLMVGHVIVQSPEDFAAWLRSKAPVSQTASSANNF
jgi:cytochrome c oxidase subunit 2